jgi:hypothetical protein
MSECEFHGSQDFLTCAEAAIARRSDYSLGRLPEDQPLPRARPAGAAERPEPQPGAAPHTPVHGTTWGYQRGCREDRTCPHWRRGKVTCAEARRAYLRSYTSDRLAGRGSPLEHGTSNGYLMGCRDARLCPGDGAGLSCSAARSAYRRDLARAAGIAPRAETVDAQEAARAVRSWLDEGQSVRAIAARTGVGRTTIAALAQPEPSGRRRLTPSTMKRILAER